MKSNCCKRSTIQMHFDCRKCVHMVKSQIEESCTRIFMHNKCEFQKEIKTMMTRSHEVGSKTFLSVHCPRYKEPYEVK